MRWSEADGGRSFVRALPVPSGSAPPFDISAAPAEPLPLFVEWIEQAARAGVPEPHAMAISTVDAQAAPRTCADFEGRRRERLAFRGELDERKGA